MDFQASFRERTSQKLWRPGSRGLEEGRVGLLRWAGFDGGGDV